MFSLHLNTDQFSRQIKTFEAGLITTVKDVEIPRYFQRLQSIAADATELGRIQIKLATTITGKKRAAQGSGSPGRIESGSFHSKLKWEANRRGKGLYEVRIGWLDGEPDWATYQELGFTHRSGMYVVGADALGAARRYAALEIEKLKR